MMTKCTFVCAGMLLLQCMLPAAQPIVCETDFEITPDKKMPSAVKGMSKGCSIISDMYGNQTSMAELKPSASIQLGPVTLRNNVKYKLTFRARIIGDMTIESNPQLEEAFYDTNRHQKGLILPRWEKSFSGSDGKYRNSHILYSYYNTIVSGEWTMYTDVFYAAPDSGKVTLSFNNPSQEDTVCIDDVKLEEFTESALNINPEFKLGKYCHAGYGMAGYGSAVRMTESEKEKGNYCMNVQTWISSDPMPVEPGKNYVIEAKLAPNPTKGNRVNITFFDADMKDIKNSGGSLLAKKADGGGKTNFIAPPNAAYMRMLIYDAMYQSIKVTQEDIIPEK